MESLLQDSRAQMSIAVLAAVLLSVAVVVWRKGRPFAGGHVFRASRLSRGNRLFPTQVLISSTTFALLVPDCRSVPLRPI